MRKPFFGVFDKLGSTKPGCTSTGDGSKRLEISDLGSRGIVLSM